MEKFEASLERILDAFIDRIPSILLALLILIIGFWLVRMLNSVLHRRFKKGRMDISVSEFLLSIIRVILYILVLLSVASTLGIATTSFVAILGAASLAIGLSLQGSLANFAGGILILFFKPFRVGHFISSSNSVSGTVLRIDILYTTLRAGNGTTIYAPNGPLANAVINNVSDNETRQMEYKIGISYEANIDTARKAILQTLTSDPLVLDEPKPAVLVDSLGDNAVVLVIRGWAKNKDFWPTYHANYEKIKMTLDANGIELPFPQRDVRIIDSKKTDDLS